MTEFPQSFVAGRINDMHEPRTTAIATYLQQVTMEGITLAGDDEFTQVAPDQFGFRVTERTGERGLTLPRRPSRSCSKTMPRLS